MALIEYFNMVNGERGSIELPGVEIIERILRFIKEQSVEDSVLRGMLNKQSLIATSNQDLVRAFNHFFQTLDRALLINYVTSLGTGGNYTSMRRHLFKEILIYDLNIDPETAFNVAKHLSTDVVDVIKLYQEWVIFNNEKRKELEKDKDKHGLDLTFENTLPPEFLKYWDGVPGHNGIYRSELDKEGVVWLYDQNGKFHNDNGPAVIRPDTSFSYYIHGIRHRTDGPALVVKHDSGITDEQSPFFSMEWYQNGLLHRLDGPAVMRPKKGVSKMLGVFDYTWPSYDRYYIYGKEYSKEEFEDYLKSKEHLKSKSEESGLDLTFEKND